MILASDLDQTLIYSQRHFKQEDVKNVVLVEKNLDREISFMTSTAFSVLKYLSGSVFFIPVTMRTTEQFLRISAFHREILTSAAVTSNGGRVFIKGVEDTLWRKKVEMRIQDESLPLAEVICEVDRIRGDEWIISSSIADNLFYCLVIKREKIPHYELNELIARLVKKGWKAFLQERKLYFIPNGLCKSFAVRHLKEHFSQEVFASGDSLLDEQMLKDARYSMAPSHGELFEKYKNETFSPFKFSNRSGIYAAEDILEDYLQKLVAP
jgi:hydroxymethylpyrimidine pyrophosphatase-like HAD family hydrolase